MTQTKAQLIDGKSAEIEFAGGSASAPAISFTGDANTGIYSPGADQVAISTNGTGRLFVDASGNVGIGGSPTALFSAIGGSVEVSGPTYNYVQVQATGGPQGQFSSNGSNSVELRAVTNHPLVFYTNNTESLRITSDGKVGVGTSGPAGLLDIRVNASPQKDIIAGLTAGSPMFTYRNGSGTWFHAGKHPTEEGFVLTAGATTTSNELLRVDGSGRVGVGVTIPQQALDVSGNINLNPLGTTAGRQATYTLGVGDDGTVGQKARIAFEGTGSNGFLTDITFSNFTGDFYNATLQERLRITSDGKVGVGTTSPGSYFSDANELVIADTVDSGLTIASGASHKGTIAFADGTTGDQAYRGYIQYNHSTDSLQLATTGTERARIDSSGRLLVGTSSTSGIGNLQVRKNSSGTATGVVEIGTSDGYASITSGNTLGILRFTEATNSGTFAQIYAEADSTVGNNDYPGRLVFSTTADGASSPTERMRISANGQALFTQDSTSTGSAGFKCTSASYDTAAQYISVARSGNSAFNFLVTYSNSFADVEHKLRGDGNAYADGSWNGGGADYAEYFEWSDGNLASEDRRGISVVLDGDKIREAQAGEDPIGVISGNPSVVGDAAWNKWSGKYLRDEFGTYIQEDYEVTDDDGNTVIQQRRKLNPAYDPDAEYISREERPEWDCVGLMGKLRIRKGQVTGSRWIKMRDISDSVEEWLVR